MVNLKKALLLSLLCAPICTVLADDVKSDDYSDVFGSRTATMTPGEYVDYQKSRGLDENPSAQVVKPVVNVSTQTEVEADDDFADCDSSAGLVQSLEDFTIRVQAAQQAAYGFAKGSVKSGVRPCVIGVGNAGIEIVSMLSQKIVGNPFCDKLITLMTDTDTARLTDTSRSLFRVLPASQKAKTLMLKLGGKDETTGAGGDPKEANLAMLGAQHYFRELLRPDATTMAPNLLFVVAAVGGGTGTGGLEAVIDLARRNHIPTVAVIVLPFNKGIRGSAIAMNGLRSAIDNADTVIPISCKNLISSSPELEVSGDNSQYKAIDEKVVDRLIALLELIAANAEGYRITNSPDLADFRSKIGIKPSTFIRTCEGKISIVESSTVRGRGCVQEALRDIFQKLCLEYKNFRHIIERAENLLISIQYSGSEHDEGLEHQALNVLKKVGFKSEPTFKVGQKTRLSSFSSDGIPSAKVTLFLGGLNFGFGMSLDAQWFGLDDRGWFERLTGSAI